MGDLSLDVPVPFFSGQALAHRGIRRDSQSLNTNRRFIYFITNNGQSSTIGVGLGWQPAQVGQVGSFTYDVPLLTQADDQGGPTSGRAQKVNVEIHVTTPLLNRGSAYFVGEFNTRLAFTKDPTTMNGGEADTLFNELTSFPQVNSYDTAKDARMRVNGNVVDHMEYNTFQEWHGTRNATDMFRHIGIFPGVNPLSRPMTTVMIAFEAPANNQTAMITMGARFYCRHPIGTIPGRLMKDLPVAKQDSINAITTGGRGGNPGLVM